MVMVRVDVLLEFAWQGDIVLRVVVVFNFFIGCSYFMLLMVIEEFL